MELFTPDFGLVFWMFIAFLVLFLILAKWGWPMIIKSMNSRADRIDQGVEYARQAKDQLDSARSDAQKVIKDAQKQQANILRDAEKMKTQIIDEARKEASSEAKKVMDAAKVSIDQSRKEAERQLRQQVGQFSVRIAEKLVRQQMADDKQQQALADKLLDEIEKNQN